jgi:uncharacterized protein (TIGR00251 family)
MINHYKRDIKENGYCVLQVKVKTKTPMSRITGRLDNGTLKIDIKAVPEKGKANEELLKILSSSFQVPRQNVTIIKGKNSRLKVIKINI